MLKKIEDFDITYESSDKDSGEIYIDYNNIVFVLEHYIYEVQSSTFLED